MTTLELSTLHKLVKAWTEEAIAFRQKRDYQTSTTLQSCALELQNTIEKLSQPPPDTTP